MREGNTMTIRTILAAAVLPFAALPGLARAQEAPAEEESGAFTIEGEVGVLSDYRFRGLSLSGKEPEVTASLTVSHESGFYVSAWASNVELGNGKANNAEMDWTAGFSKDLGGVTADIGGVYYTYLNHSDLNYWEVYGSLGTKVGPADVKLGLAYAPKQDHLGGEDNTYVYVSGEMPFGDSPLSAHASLGWEDGVFADKKLDWSAGLAYDLGSGFTADVSYVDSHRSFSTAGDPTVVASLKWGF